MMSGEVVAGDGADFWFTRPKHVAGGYSLRASQLSDFMGLRPRESQPLG